MLEGLGIEKEDQKALQQSIQTLDDLFLIKDPGRGSYTNDYEDLPHSIW